MLGGIKFRLTGIPWNIETDKIKVVFPPVGGNTKVNKRLVLKQLASVFDPLGFASPSLLPAKLFFQSLWGKQKDWDSILSEEETKEWSNIIETWKIAPIEIERKVIPKMEFCSCTCFLTCQRMRTCTVSI